MALSKHELTHEILKACREHQHSISVRVLWPGGVHGNKPGNYKLVELPPDLWADRVLSFIESGTVPVPKPEKPHSAGMTIATCGHAVSRVMWSIIVKENYGETGSVVCPDCYRRFYRRDRRLKSSERVLLNDYGFKP